jgi:putative addiction module antidote
VFFVLQAFLGHQAYSKESTAAKRHEESIMNKKLKVTAIGNSTGVILPKELLEKLRVSRGDELMVHETPDGIMLTPYDPEFARQMDVAEKIMRRRRNLLKKLAE